MPGDGNLIVVTQDGPGEPPVRTLVNAATVAAGQVNPAMAAVSALLDYVRPGQLFVLGDAAQGGTGRYSLADDSTDGEETPQSRLWGDFTSVVDMIEAEFGPVGHLIECWYNNDAARITSFRDSFWPFYFGVNADGSPFALGDTVNSRRIDHCLYDASVAAGQKGRGVFTRDTAWHIATPMPFLDAPVDPSPEMDGFSANSPRMREPARAAMHALAQDALAQSVNLRVGPSAHLCRFGGNSTQIHPDTGHADGQVLMAWPAVAIPLLRASGMTIGEPTIIGTEGPADGSYVDVLVDLPNGGELATLAALRGTEYAGSAPHQQDVTGFEITRAGGQRRPVFRADQADRPASHRGTVAIVDAGSGVPRRGRIRITPLVPFAFGDSVSFLRGQATAVLLEPRDFDLYPWFPIEHVPALFDASATYPMEGIAVRPYQEELTVPVSPASDFEPRGAYFDGASYYASRSGTTVVAGDRGLLSVWLRNNDVTWNATSRRVFQLRVDSTVTLEVNVTSNGRLSLRLNNDTASNTNPIYAAQPGNIGFDVGAWHHVLIGWGPGGAAIYVDGEQVATLSFASVDMAGQAITQIGVGAQSTGATPWLGDIGHLYINLAETLDLSEPANIAKFIKDGAPVDLGANGELPTGNAPAFYYDGDPPAWANQGTVGNITLTGALGASELAPML